MKNLINIYNQATGNESVTLNDLREMICSRRYNALNPLNRKDIKSTINVHTTDKLNKQVAAHYPSYEIRRFSHNKAISVFNAGGHQVATLIENN